ncbi:MAG TPA: glycosyltransferase [Burkholderiales bacterium]|nr:glycosyltransferase [Burkholderiales bacterium]
MHVADVTMFYAPQGGGVRRYIEAKRAWLNSRSGCSHTLVVPKAGDAPREAHTVGLASLPLPLSHGYRVPLGRSPAARTLVELQPNVIEAGDPYMLAWAALDAGQRLGVPVVGFCHSDLPRLLCHRYGRRVEHIAALYYARLYREFDLVLAPSRAMTARLRGWGVRRATYQPLGVDIDVFHPSRRDTEMRRRLDLPDDSRLVVYAGRFAPEKNLDVLAHAMRLLGSRYVALWIGAGRVPTDLPANVRILPYISEREALARVLAGCDAFIHPGDQETFGLAALEAMACGLPVIGARAAGVGELVTPEVGALVPARDARALAEAVAALYERDLKMLGLHARRLAERYAWGPVLTRIVDRYSALAVKTRH